jgi:hydroxymethylbilane synthase
MASERRRVVIGSRDSALAMIQSRLVQAMLAASHPSVDFEIASTSSLGDKNLLVPLAQLATGTPGLFTKELEVGA